MNNKIGPKEAGLRAMREARAAFKPKNRTLPKKKVVVEIKKRRGRTGK